MIWVFVDVFGDVSFRRFFVCDWKKGDDYMSHGWICTYLIFWILILRYINKMGTNGGGGVADGVPLQRLQAILVPGWSPNLVFFFANFCTNSYIQIYNSYVFYTNCIVQIYTYTNCLVQIHTIRTFFIQIVLYQFIQQAARANPEPQARSASCEGEARAHLLPRPGRTRLPRR